MGGNSTQPGKLQLDSHRVTDLAGNREAGSKWMQKCKSAQAQSGFYTGRVGEGDRKDLGGDE